MSRTVRRLPVTGGSLKWYASVDATSVKRQGRTLCEFRPGVHYSYGLPERAQEAWRALVDTGVDPVSIHLGHSSLTVDRTCWLQETEEDVARENARTFMQWCRKNGTCKRQRKNAVHAAKRTAAGRARAKGRMDLHRLARAAEGLQEADEDREPCRPAGGDSGA